MGCGQSVDIVPDAAPSPLDVSKSEPPFHRGGIAKELLRPNSGVQGHLTKWRWFWSLGRDLTADDDVITRGNGGSVADVADHAGIGS